MASRARRTQKYKYSDDSNEEEQEEKTSTAQSRSSINMFANDGSFIELFKKRMEERPTEADVQQSYVNNDMAVEAVSVESSSSVPSYDTKDNEDHVITVGEHSDRHQVPEKKKTSVLSFVGKRRGGKVLPTGMVKKPKQEGEQGDGKTDAWSQYMAEVRKYKERSCEDEGKRRPLVK